MTTPRTVTCDYAKDPDSVAKLLRDPEFLRSRSEDAGERNVEVTIEQASDGLRVMVARDKQVDLPGFAKRMFSPKNRITDDVKWRHDGEHWVGEYSIDVAGVPGEVKGKSTLIPTSTGCRHVSSFEVTARVPLIGSKLEGFVADRIEETFREHGRRNAARLSS